MAETKEVQTLLDALRSQRHHIRGIIAGLDDAELRRPVLPSGWNCLGLVQHLTLDVERFWVRGVVSGDQEVIDWVGSGGEDAWLVPNHVAAETIIGAYRAECERADAIISATPLTAAPAWWPPDLFGDWRLDSVREVVLHVIVETAGHAGHLDAARELIDGKQWMVLT